MHEVRSCRWSVISCPRTRRMSNHIICKCIFFSPGLMDAKAKQTRVFIFATLSFVTKIACCRFIHTGLMPPPPLSYRWRALPVSTQNKIHQHQLAPENPKAWRALVDFLETGNDNKKLAEALNKCVEIAESKGNFGRSRPLRIRLSEVLEAAGDRRGALAALKAFTSNPAAVSSTTAAEAPEKNVSAAVKMAAAASLKAAEAVRDSENAAMKDRSTRLFMEVNADLVPACAPVPPPAPVRTVARPAAAKPAKPTVTTVAAAAARAQAAAAASASGPKLTAWVRNAAKAASQSSSSLSAEQIAALEDGERLQNLAGHCGVLEEAGDASARRRAAVAIANSIAASNAEAPWVEAQLREFVGEGSTPAAREGALLAIHAICELAGAGGEAYVVSLLPLVLQANGAQAAPVRAAAADAGAAVARTVNPHAVRVVLPMMTTAVESDTWRIKAGALEVMAILAESSPKQVALALPEIVPVVSHQIWDTKKEVQAASKHALLAACACIGNPDIEPLVSERQKELE